jgi:hypothetical protein
LSTKNRSISLKISLLLSGFLFAVFLLVQGYVFGFGDLEELNSLAMHMADPALFSRDLFVQDALKMGISHRSFTALLISFAGLDYIPSLAFGWFIGSALLLFSGQVMLLSNYLSNQFSIVLVILLSSLFTYDLNVGGHDLYNNGFSGTLLAEGLLCWAWHFLIKKQYHKMVLFSIPATFAHPLEGVQFFAISTLVLSWLSFQNEIRFKNWGLPVLVYCLTAGIYVFVTFLAIAEDKQYTTMYIKIAYYFRSPHHYDVFSYSKKGMLLMLALTIWGLPQLWKQNQLLAKASIIILLGALVYTLGTVFLRSNLFFTTEWFRTFIWLKLFLFMALVKRLEQFYPKPELRFNPIWVTLTTLILIPIALILPIAEHQYPWSSHSTEAQEIAKEAKRLIPVDALVLHPLGMSEFRCFAERSSFVSMKAVPVRKEGMIIWYERVNEAFGQNFDSKANGFKMIPLADQFLKNTEKEQLIRLKKQGITHLVTFTGVEYPNLRKLAANSAYILYEL